LAEPDQPFLGTIRLDGLPYTKFDLNKFYPYGKDVTYEEKPLAPVTPR
jgi:hypothetical protein